MRSGGLVKRGSAGFELFGAAVILTAASAVQAADLEGLADNMKQQEKQLQEQRLLIDKLEKQIDQLGSSQKPAVGSRTQMEIYGGLIPFAERVQARSATTAAPAIRPNQLAAGAYTGTNQEGRGRMTVGTSHIGFRGTQQLADGYQALWQIEAGAALDGDSAVIGNTNVFGLRNSRVGVAGPFGTAFLGNWDTPYKAITMPIVPMKGVTTFDYNVVIGNPGFGVFATTAQSGRVGGKADASFDRRQGNSIQYWTPNLSGFSAQLAYSLDEGKSSATTVPSISPAIWSMSAGYTSGPFSLHYAYERHDDYFGMAQLGGATASATNTSSKDDAHKLVGTFAIANTKLIAVYEQLAYRNSDAGAATNVKEYERSSYYLSAQQNLGFGKAWVAYGQAEDGRCTTAGAAACVTNGLGAKTWNAGYGHSLNKFTDLFVGYYEVKNSDSGTYQPINSVGLAPNATPAPGLAIRGVGVGVAMLF